MHLFYCRIKTCSASPVTRQRQTSQVRHLPVCLFCPFFPASLAPVDEHEFFQPVADPVLLCGFFHGKLLFQRIDPFVRDSSSAFRLTYMYF